ncbi:hypothetical protein [Kribbella sp. NPDC055071]
MDWERQSRWMLLTRVWATENGGSGVGGGVAARTSVGAVGFTDDMVITHWDPPRECTVKHLGKVVRGTGTFTVTPTSTPDPTSPAGATSPADPTSPAGARSPADATSAGGPAGSAGGGRSRFTWGEDVVPPFGRVGVAVWPVVRVGFEWMMRVSLRRLVREVAG